MKELTWEDSRCEDYTDYQVVGWRDIDGLFEAFERELKLVNKDFELEVVCDGSDNYVFRIITQPPTSVGDSNAKNSP